MTEKRYFLLVLGCWLLLLSLYFIFSKKKSIRVVPASLLVIATLSLFGPWSAYNISLKSQFNRALSILTQHKLIQDGKLQKKKDTSEVSAEDEKQLTAIFNYILQHHGVEKLTQWFPEDILEPIEKKPILKSYYQRPTSKALMEFLGLNYNTKYHHQYFSYSATIKKNPIAISEYNHLFELRSSTKLYTTFAGKKLEIRGSKDKSKLTAYIANKKIGHFDLGELITKIQKTKERGSYSISSDKMILDLSSKEHKLMLFVRSIGGNLNDKTPKINHFNAFLFIK